MSISRILRLAVLLDLWSPFDGARRTIVISKLQNPSMKMSFIRSLTHSFIFV